jgi:hypothetical protein
MRIDTKPHLRIEDPNIYLFDGSTIIVSFV